MDSDFLEKLTDAAASGRVGRGPASLCRPDMWISAAEVILRSPKTAIVTGFFISSVSAPETDGPPGAAVLACVLRTLGREVSILTDGRCLGAVRAAAVASGLPPEVVMPADGSSRVDTETTVIYIERPGRALDGRFYNMHGDDISSVTEPLDEIARDSGAPSAAIGDGGNEAGMGPLRAPLAELLPDYAPHLCCGNSDAAIPVDVSNWGGYALAAVLSGGRHELYPVPGTVTRILRAMKLARAVDGVSREPSLTVDGLPDGTEEEVFDKIYQLLE